MTETTSSFRRVCLPYCLRRLQDGRYIVLNRQYKPLGCPDEFVDYDTHPSAQKIAGLTPARIRKIAYSGLADEDGSIYLYNDGCVPTTSDAHWNAYAKRLHALSKLTVGESKA